MDRQPPSDRQQTVTAEALGEGHSDPVHALVEAHRAVALRHLREGSVGAAFTELVHAARAVPMGARLAAYLVRFSLGASTQSVAVTLLSAALEETEGEVRTAVRRQLARLFRRMGERERAREMLVLLLAEAPRDLRARRVLEALLALDARWDELDASLERTARDELRRGKPARAARAVLDRARIDERRGDLARAALRYGQAAGHLDQAKALRAAFEVRLLWLRALRESRAPDRAVAEAVDAFLESAVRAGSAPRAQAAAVARDINPGNGARTDQGRRETRRELLQAGSEPELGAGSTGDAGARREQVRLHPADAEAVQDEAVRAQPPADDRAMTALELPAVIVEAIEPAPPSRAEEGPQEVPFVLDAHEAFEDSVVEEITSADLLPIALELPRAATPVWTRSPGEAPPVMPGSVPWMLTGEHPAVPLPRPPEVETREHRLDAPEPSEPRPPVEQSEQPAQKDPAQKAEPTPAAPPSVEVSAELTWEAPPGAKDEGPPTIELPVPLGDLPVVPTASLPTPLLRSLRDRRAELLTLLREDPLGPEGYRRLGDYYEDVGDAARCALMRELYAALEGDPDASPLAPKLILSATDRAALRHPVLRGPEGELLALGGIALCRAHPAKGREAGTREEFRLDGGRGAGATAEALMAAVRILGLPAPDPFLSEDNGPPFSLVFAGSAPKLLVGRLAVKKPLPEPELRFFAGRALFTQSPDLLALRTVRREDLERAVPVLFKVVSGARGLSPDALAMREGISPRALPRLQTLFTEVGAQLPIPRLGEAARHSANRAGLVVAGGVAPALAAMRAKRALKSEVVELLRFAASERYLELRTRRLG